MKQDKQHRRKLGSFYTEAMTIIGNHLNQFYLQYADENGLSLKQTEAKVRQWDMDQFQAAIKELLKDRTPDDDLTKQIQQAYVESQRNRRGTMLAIISAGVAVATSEAKDYGKSVIHDEYVEGHQSRSGRAPVQVPDSTSKAEDYQQRAQVHGEVAVSRMHETLNSGLRRGLSQKDMRVLTHVYPPKSKRIKGNLSSELNKLVTRSQGLIVDKATRANNNGQAQAFNDAKVEYVYFMTENDSRVCDKCDRLVGVWPVKSAPQPGKDTHPGCRCQLVPCDKDGNILPGFIW